MCLKKFKAGDIESAIVDAHDRGRNPEITDEEKSWLINIVCWKPVDLGYSAETWTYSKLTGHINDTVESASYIRFSTITKTIIKNILESGEPLVAAMALYRKIGYKLIPDYGQYKDMPDSICMKKKL